MNSFQIIFASTVAASFALAILAAFRLSRNLKTIPGQAMASEAPRDKPMAKARGAVKISNVLSVFTDGTIRTRNGGYIRGYRFQPSETIYANAGDVEKLYNNFALTITGNFPKDTVIQFRFENAPDEGNLINEQVLQLQTAENCNDIAQLLKMEELNFYSDLAGQGKFRTCSFYAWIYIPDGRNGKSLNAFSSISSAFRAGDLEALKNAFFANTKDIVTRLMSDEEKSYTSAEKHFRNFQQSFPLKIEQLSFADTCVQLRRSHNPNSTSMPVPPQLADTDWTSYICRTSILQEKDSWYVQHGRTPFTVVSLFEPMESSSENQSCYAGLMRFITINPNLRDRCTIVTEYVSLDKDQSVKDITKELKRIRQTNTRPSGRVEMKDDKTRRAYEEKTLVKSELTTPGKALTAMRFRVIICGDPILTKEDKKKSIRDLENRANDLIKIINQNMQGAQAGIEDPVAVRDIFERSLIGELCPKPQHREIREQANSLACFIPAESIWKGMTNQPHNSFVTTGGELLGVNLLRNPHSSSPLTVITGVSGSGKSVLAGELITGFLATVANARVRACDYGGSLAPLVQLFNGRHFTFSAKDPRTINVWDYAGLEHREMADDDQVELVVKDTLILLGADERTEQGKDFSAILEKCVRSVYKDEIPRNLPGRRHEPTLSHLIRKLRTYPFESAEEKSVSTKMAGRLENFEGNPWVDAPTHETYRNNSKIDVFELSSLEKLQDQLRSCLAFRIGARVGAGGEDISGINDPMMVVYDEVHEYVSNEYLSFALRGAERTTRHGRKKNKLPVLITHSFSDIEDYTGFTSNLGTIFVGKQDDISALIKLRKFNAVIEKTIQSIDNVKGMAHQFFMATGQGDTQKMATIQVYLPPINLWTLTTDPPETEAREIVKKAFPHWHLANVLVWLSRTYPRGLSFAGKTRIEDDVLFEAIQEEASVNPRYRAYLRDLNKSGTGLLTIPDQFEMEEIADELTELVVDTIDNIQRRNFEQVNQPDTYLDEIRVDFPGAIVVNVQEAETVGE